MKVNFLNVKKIFEKKLLPLTNWSNSSENRNMVNYKSSKTIIEGPILNIDSGHDVFGTRLVIEYNEQPSVVRFKFFF